MTKACVALVSCDSYDEEKVYEAVKTGIELLGGLSRFAGKQERILLKPNLLGRALPQKAVTTHPSVFGAVARLLAEEGYGRVAYGDSPGSPGVTPDKAAQTAGLTAQAQRYGLTRADFDGGSTLHSDGYGMVVCNGARNAEAIINLPKMKTHALERITGAMKNIYGCVQGANKPAGHMLYPDSGAFADMLCALHRALPLRLHILDGITAMEGNGPTSGTPINMNLLLFSADPVALDSVFASLVYLEPALVPTCVSGERAGLGCADTQNITVLTREGEISVEKAAELYGNAGFDVFRGRLKKGFFAKIIPLTPFLQERPRVDSSKCIGCGLCSKACPVPSKAVTAGGGVKARYDYGKCIRCYCCQEMCPEKAISVYRNPLNKLFSAK